MFPPSLAQRSQVLRHRKGQKHTSRAARARAAAAASKSGRFRVTMIPCSAVQARVSRRSIFFFWSGEGIASLIVSGISLLPPSPWNSVSRRCFLLPACLLLMAGPTPTWWAMLLYPARGPRRRMREVGWGWGDAVSEAQEFHTRRPVQACRPIVSCPEISLGYCKAQINLGFDLGPACQFSKIYPGLLF